MKYRVVKNFKHDAFEIEYNDAGGWECVREPLKEHSGILMPRKFETLELAIVFINKEIERNKARIVYETEG